MISPELLPAAFMHMTIMCTTCRVTYRPGGKVSTEF
jgi:hypothetical protein